MSALLVDDLVITTARHPQPRRWRHVRGSGSDAQVVQFPLAPEAPVEAGRSAAATRPIGISLGSWQLTARGLAVLMGLFVTVVAIAAIVLVGGFLAVSNAPIAESFQLATQA